MNGSDEAISQKRPATWRIARLPLPAAAAWRVASRSYGPPSRRRIAVIAVLTGVLNSAAMAASGGSAAHLAGAAIYAGLTILVLAAPNWLPAQVITGQILAGSILLALDGAGALLLVPVVAAIIATAELLALAGRMDSPIARDPGNEMHRAGLAAAVGGAVFATVAFLANTLHLTGLTALILASLAVAGLVLLLLRLTARS